MRRGEIWWAESPQTGRRPHLVLTRDSAIPVLRSVLVVPATRTMRGIPTEVPIGPEDGMPESCVLSLDNVTVASKSLLTERICRLGPEKLGAVCGALRVAADC